MKAAGAKASERAERGRHAAAAPPGDRPPNGARQAELGKHAKGGDSSVAAAHAYEEIKRRIIELRYPPGAKLSEVQLVEELGYGRSPIRTAFARLKSEGWVTISPQSGTYVKRLSEDEIDEIYDFRLLLETHVSRLAAKNVTDDQLRELHREFRRRAPMKDERFDEHMFDDLNELDAIVHATVYRAAGNSLITDVLLNLLEKVEWLKKATPSSPERMKQWRSELDAVVDALERRDSEAAARRMREHIGHAADSGSESRRSQPARREASVPPAGEARPGSRLRRVAHASRKATR